MQGLVAWLEKVSRCIVYRFQAAQLRPFGVANDRESCPENDWE
jgi:hypothetical protein